MLLAGKNIFCFYEVDMGMLLAGKVYCRIFCTFSFDIKKLETGSFANSNFV